MAGWKNGVYPFGEDPGMAAAEHLSKTLTERQVIVPFRCALLAKNLSAPQQLLEAASNEAHGLREPKAAQALEAAEEAIQDARDYLMGRKR